MRSGSVSAFPAEPPKGQDLTEVPPDLDQNFSSVRQALGELLQSAAQLGYFPTSWNATPKQTIADFYKQDPRATWIASTPRSFPTPPAIKQAEAKLLQADDDLDQAKLNLRYCDIVSDIDGVVTRRNVNPGNYRPGRAKPDGRPLAHGDLDRRQLQGDAAGRPAHRPAGRAARWTCTAASMSSRAASPVSRWAPVETLALLPPQNATGNFVKIVQRLPVRIELTDYDPDKDPLFVGLSVIPTSITRNRRRDRTPGTVLQPLRSLPQVPTDPKP